MSIKSDMQRITRRAPSLLREATDGVVEFLLGQFNADGGGKDRSGKSDLYYSVFAINGLAALGGAPPTEAIVRHLRGFGDGGELDFIHQACLARCWAAMPSSVLEADTAPAILHNLESHRSADGGYGIAPACESGTIYNCFLALGAYQDLGCEPPDSHKMIGCLDGLRADDGAFANEQGMTFGTTPATAAAVVVMRQLGEPVPRVVGDWLMARCFDQGGFLAVPDAPIPDLLSTATALHALAELDRPLDDIRETCLDFVDSLWTGRTFRGHWADDVEDCEYTYYALLALGHLCGEPA